MQMLQPDFVADSYDLPLDLQRLAQRCGDQLDLAARALVQSGEARSFMEAFDQLAEVAKAASGANRRELLTQTALKGSTHTQTYLELRALIEPELERQKFFARRLGALMHQMVTLLRIGALPNYRAIHHQPELDEVVQLAFQGIPRQLKRQVRLFNPQLPHSEKILPDNSVWPGHMERIDTLYTNLKAYLRTKIWWEDHIHFPEHEVGELDDHLRPLVYPCLSSVHRDTMSARQRYLYALTLLELAGVVLTTVNVKHKPIFAHEIMPLPIEYGVHPGIIYLVRIDPDHDGVWDARTEATLRILGAQYRGDLFGLDRRVRSIAPDAHFTLNEMKFPVGDHKSHHGILNPAFEKLPTGHHRQVIRYIALSALSYPFAAGIYDTRALGQAAGRLPEINALLEYFSPDFSVSETYPVAIPEREVERTIEDEYVRFLDRANETQQVRDQSSAILRHALRIIQGKKHPVRRSAPSGVQEMMFDTPRGAFVRILNALRYADPHHIVRRERVENGHELIMDVGRLLAAIRRKWVNAPRFKLEGNSKVACFFPEHPADKRHNGHARSLHICLTARNPFFYCKTGLCGMTGRIDVKSVPESSQHLLIPKRLTRTSQALFDSSTVPSEHFAVMECAHEYMVGKFEESPALSYLQNRRKINPDLARAYGVGYADKYLVAHVLEAFLKSGRLPAEAFSLLVRSGLIGFSEKPRHWFLDQLRDLGFGPRHWERKERDHDKSGAINLVTKYAYPTLDNHVTFPLDMGDSRTLNFQARVVGDSDNLTRKHIKLKTVGAQGGFNLGILPGLIARREPVYVAEGSLDALSKMQLWDMPTVALIGTNNELVLNLLADAGIPVGLALDNDLSGHQSAQRCIRKMYARNPKGDYRNWTAVAWDQLVPPEIRQAVKTDGTPRCKDWSEVLVQSGGEAQLPWRDLWADEYLVCPFYDLTPSRNQSMSF